MLIFFNRKRKKGQSTLEYAILIVIIIGALLSIQYYIKRGMQGRWKSNTDDIGDQFSPGNMFSNTTKNVGSTSNETFLTGVSETVIDDDTHIDMTACVINGNFEYFGN